MKKTVMNLKGIDKELAKQFKTACKRGKVSMTTAIKYYMEGVVLVEDTIGEEVNTLLPERNKEKKEEPGA